MGSVQQIPLRFSRHEVEGVVEQACSAWDGTPYRHGQCAIGIGVDCIHFGAAVLDTLYGSLYSKDLRSLPPDACVHNRHGVEVAMRSLLRAYPAVKRCSDGSVEPGDLLVFAPVLQGAPAAPAHLMVAGGHGRLWHATHPRVCFTGYLMSTQEALLAVYRAEDKEKWLHARSRD